MMRPLLLITAATGKTGAAVVAELRAKDWPVRALSMRAIVAAKHLNGWAPKSSSLTCMIRISC